MLRRRIPFPPGEGADRRIREAAEVLRENSWEMSLPHPVLRATLSPPETIRVDADVLGWFRARVVGGGNCQTLINDALRAHITDSEGALERTLRRIIREELHSE
ncbi:MAG: BrnA antitoxin family protein [Lysobacterales bacterium]